MRNIVVRLEDAVAFLCSDEEAEQFRKSDEFLVLDPNDMSIWNADGSYSALKEYSELFDQSHEVDADKAG